MKKIALIATATLALGLAACQPATTETNNATDVNATEIEAGNDIDNAAIDDNAAISNTNDALDGNLGTAAANTASDLGNAATDAGNAVSNAVD